VKASFEIESEGASEVVARALRLAMAPPFGPVHLDLPPSMAAEISAGREVASLYWTFPVAFDQWVSAPVRRGLERAQCPVIVARMDAPCPGVREPLTVLVERIDTPLS
jgi:acetolactate synthase-1/2/3 large subunit